ncbi:MAG: HAMP domain-containing protein [Parasphingorhabdus sp.]|jgi:HAMP domain-containing protein
MATRISWYSKIRTKITTAIFLTTTIVVGAAGYFAYVYTEQTKTAELNQLAEATAIAMSQHLVIPMWDVDYELAGKLLEAEMNDGKISGIVVRDEDKRTLFAARERDGSGSVIDSSGSIVGNNISSTQDVINGDKNIGTVAIFITTDFLTVELEQFRNAIVVIVIGLNFVIYLTLTLFLNGILIRPLRELEESAERMSKGELGQPIRVRSQDEIGSLASTLELMRNSLNMAINRIRADSRKGTG